MPDIDVKGIGTLTFPDSMSEKEIEDAIKQHPEYEHARAKSQLKPLIEPPQWLKNWLGKPEDSPNPTTVARVGAKGIPIAGGLVPQDQSMTDMEKEWPKASIAAKIGTGTVATAPLTLGASTLAGAKFLPQLAAQGTLGGVLGGGDAAVKGGNIAGGTAEGAAWGMAGPVISKLLSPGALPAAPTNPMPPEKPTVESIRAASRIATGVDPPVNPQLAALQAQRAAQAKEAAKQATENRLHLMRERFRDNSWHAAGRAATMGFIGSHTGHPAIATTLALLGAAAPHLPRVGAAYAHNTVMQQPSTKDILTLLLQGTQGQITP